MPTDKVHTSFRPVGLERPCQACAACWRIRDDGAVLCARHRMIIANPRTGCADWDDVPRCPDGELEQDAGRE